MTIRTELEAALKSALPKAWAIVPVQDNLDRLSKTTVMLKQGRIEKAPQNPQGSHLLTYTATIIDPSTDPRKAEYALDESVNELLYALDGITWLNWSSAEKVFFANEYLAYDVSLEIITRKDA